MSACGALAGIAANFAAGKVAAVATGVGQIISAALAAHPADAALAKAAAGALQVISADAPRPEAPLPAQPTPLLLPPSPDRLPDASMPLTRIVEIMELRGGGDAAVAEAGARALVALTGGAGSRAEREGLLRALHVNMAARTMEAVCAGSLRVLLRSLAAHAHVAAVVEVAAIALANVASDDAGRAAAIEAGSVPAVTAALRANAPNASACARICGLRHSVECLRVRRWQKCSNCWRGSATPGVGPSRPQF